MLRSADPARVSCKKVSTRAAVENAEQLCTRIQCGEDWIPLSLCSGKVLIECLTTPLPFTSGRHCHMFSWNTGPENCASWCLTQNTDWSMLTSLLGPSGCLCRSDDRAKLFGLFPLEGILLNLLTAGISVMTPVNCIHTYMHMTHFSLSYRMNQIILFLWFGWEGRWRFTSSIAFDTWSLNHHAGLDADKQSVKIQACPKNSPVHLAQVLTLLP